jgi:hypothetical protein
LGGRSVRKTYWAYAIILCCLGSPAWSAGIQLLESDPGLAALLCADPPGFDRTAFHRDFDASVVGFFREHLVGDGGTR